MILTNEFTVDAPVERTWRTLLDIERVAGCLPGAKIEPAGEDGAHRGVLTLKVGPMRMSYDGTVRVQDVDDATHTVSFDAAARERSGVGTAAASIRTQVSGGDGGTATHVRVETDLNITGRAAQFGRGIIQDVAGGMLSSFADRLHELIAEGAEGGPVPGDAVAALTNDAGPAGSRESAASAHGEETFDLGAGAFSLLGPRRVAAVAAAALAGGLVLLTRRRRPGVELTVTLRLR